MRRRWRSRASTRRPAPSRAAPSLIAQDRYGRLSGASAGIDGTLWSDTVNKETDSPGPNDDRVVRIPIPNQGGGGID